MKTKEITIEDQSFTIRQLPARVWIDIQKKTDVQGDGLEVFLLLCHSSLTRPAYSLDELAEQLTLPDLQALRDHILEFNGLSKKS